ncbi:MAG TPA: cobalt ECF transporter T component CbiQ [Anaerolineae bacterium]|nr:cobalt ECF transporter T component CbiQ [Anaerolineae bacterium]
MHYDLTDQYHHRSSPIHHLDPRVKVVVTFLYILALSITPEGTWWIFGFFLALILVAVWLTHLGLVFTIRRSFIVLPFLLAAVAVPFTTPGSILLRVPGLGWTVSEPGVVRFVSILIRSWLAVQAAILLTATTRFPDLLWALGAFRFPKPLVSTISFMYRYLFVLVDEALRMMRARAARSAQVPGRSRPSIRWQGRVAGSMVGSLFLRALARSERVYAAMLARGYDGHMRSLIRFRMTNLDWLIFVLAVLFLVTPLILSLR